MSEPYSALPKNVEVVPAVLPGNFDDLKEHLERVRFARKVQVDIVDGHFARGTTWPYKDHASFDKIVSQEHGLPLWDEFDFEFDLMIQKPLERIMDFVNAGASRIVIHAHAEGAQGALRKLAEIKADDYGEFSIKTGVALMPGDQPEVLNDFEVSFDFAQVMGIARVGRQGEPPDQRALYLVERLRDRYPLLFIQVDGAVSLENARALARAGANKLVVGSAIFKADDPRAAYDALVAEANKK